MLNRDLVPNLIKRAPRQHSELTFAAGGILLSLALALALFLPASTHADGSDIEPSDTDVQAPLLAPLSTHSRTAQIVVQQLRRNHYVDLKVNDALSSAMFDNYLEALDPGKYYFLASDIAEFEGYRYELDNALRRGDLVPAYRMFNRLQQRLIERTKYMQQAIDSGLESLDFNTDEVINIKRESVPWPTDLTAQNDLWNRRLKSQVLRMKLNDTDLEEIAETLAKRYRNQQKIALRNRSEDAFQTFINAFAATFDPHTQYFSPRSSTNFNINMSLSLEGIGAVLQSDEDATKILRLVPAGPADKSGALKPSDVISAVGQGDAGPMIDVVGWRLDDVVELIRGPKDSTVRLAVRDADEQVSETKIVTIVRNTIKLEEQAAQASVITVNEGETSRRIGVIDIPTFYLDFKGQQERDPNYRSTTKDVRKLVDRLVEEGIDGLVVDLRNNGGGSLQEADTLTSLFIASGPTVQVKASRSRPTIYSNDDDNVIYSGPMAVLVNRLSASASEIFAGAMQDYGRALVVGGQTFGKGTVQTMIPLNRGQLKLTAAKFYRVSGQSTQHQGVIPDIDFPSLFDKENIGESTLDGAMPWDVIDAAQYAPFGELSAYVADLQANHLARTTNDPHFNYYRGLMVKAAEKSARTFLSLNESKRREEKQQDDAWRLELENTLRAATGKVVAKTLDELEELQEAEADALDGDTTPATEAEEADQEVVIGDSEMQDAEEIAVSDDIEEIGEDPMLRETGRIVSDLIDLLNGDRPRMTPNQPMTAKAAPKKPIPAG
ncbi:MAG: carboxy terminal-processing peptidase [Pseudomonadales bacterium]|nr:carboxy terminal-processing peptidase [Pseudomonadales bacterium]